MASSQVAGRDVDAARIEAEAAFAAAREARGVPPDFCPGRLQRELTALDRAVELARELAREERAAAARRSVEN